MKGNKIEICKDGAIVRSHNKRIVFRENEDKSINILFRYADAQAYNPACQHVCIKGKVRETFIKLSDEAMDHLTYAWMQYKLENK